jgi:hypothetical protein
MNSSSAFLREQQAVISEFPSCIELKILSSHLEIKPRASPFEITNYFVWFKIISYFRMALNSQRIHVYNSSRLAIILSLVFVWLQKMNYHKLYYNLKRYDSKQLLVFIVFSGSRFHVTHDFGFVTLDIHSVITEDSGVYMCKAINSAGEAVSSTSLKVKCKF